VWNLLQEDMAVASPRPTHWTQHAKPYQRRLMASMFEGEEGYSKVVNRHCHGKKRSSMPANMKFQVVQIPFRIGKQANKVQKKKEKGEGFSPSLWFVFLAFIYIYIVRITTLIVKYLYSLFLLLFPNRTYQPII
jgi:hypothetical protein